MNDEPTNNPAEPTPVTASSDENVHRPVVIAPGNTQPPTAPATGEIPVQVAPATGTQPQTAPAASEQPAAAEPRAPMVTQAPIGHIQTPAPASSPAAAPSHNPQPAPVMPTEQNDDQSSPARVYTRILILAAILVVLGFGGFIALRHLNNNNPDPNQSAGSTSNADQTPNDAPPPANPYDPSTPEGAVRRLVAGIKNADKGMADSVTGDGLLTLTHEALGAPELTFFDACQRPEYGLACVESFTPFDVDNIKPKITDSRLESGKDGKVLSFAAGADGTLEFHASAYDDGTWKVERFQVIPGGS